MQQSILALDAHRVLLVTARDNAIRAYFDSEEPRPSDRAVGDFIGISNVMIGHIRKRAAS